jgi:signal transduction histidine kinase
MAAGSGDRILTVARDAMQTMDELVWSVNARNDTVERFAEYASEFAEEYLSLAGLRYRLQIQPGHEAVQFDADARRHVYLAFKEVIHNVVKHAAASEVRIGLTVEGGLLRVEVADNGRGFAGAEVAATANGLRHMRERMAAAGGDLCVDSAPASGTRVVLRAPVGGRPATT